MFYQKIAKICDIKKLKNYSRAIKNFSETYRGEGVNKGGIGNRGVNIGGVFNL